LHIHLLSYINTRSRWKAKQVYRLWDQSNFTANIDLQSKMTNVLMPLLEILDPNGGVYLNEADFRDPSFQDVFYGRGISELEAIKKKYDPTHPFYGLTAVGSRSWYTMGVAGCICMFDSVCGLWCHHVLPQSHILFLVEIPAFGSCKSYSEPQDYTCNFWKPTNPCRLLPVANCGSWAMSIFSSIQSQPTCA
jgi:hypothetical protein